MITDFQLYAALIVGTVLTVIGLVMLSLAVGWLGMRRAKREGHWCPDCGRWDEPVEILIHRIREHERE